MSYTENQPYQGQTFNPSQGFSPFVQPGFPSYAPDVIQAGINPQFLTGAPGAAAAPAVSNPAAVQANYLSPGLVSLIGLTLRTLDEINTTAGGALEKAQGAETRQSLWQIQQLTGQAKAYAFQMRGMMLQ